MDLKENSLQLECLMEKCILFNDKRFKFRANFSSDARIHFAISLYGETVIEIMWSFLSIKTQNLLWEYKF